MIIPDNPEIIYITPDQEEPPGSAVELICVATGIPPPMISWLDETLEPVTPMSMDKEYSEITGPTETFTQLVSSETVYVGDVETR